MRLDLRQAKTEATEFQLSAMAEELELMINGVGFGEPIEATASIFKTGDEVIVEAQISTMVELECSRCLESFELYLNSKIKFIIQLLDINEAQDSNDDDFLILPKTVTEYDLSDRVREALILETPLKPLCSESCKGLCPMCGTNRNENECNCTPDKNDERWDALKQLFGEN